MLERERAVLAEQAKASGKPAEIIGKMVEGRLRKYYEDVVLLEQLYVIDGESRVKQVVEKAAKELGAPVKIAGFARFALGEGIDKEQPDAAWSLIASEAGWRSDWRRWEIGGWLTAEPHETALQAGLAEDFRRGPDGAARVRPRSQPPSTASPRR